MGSSDDPISMHRYLYASADGVNNVDPSGRESVFEVNFVGAMQASLGAAWAGVLASAASPYVVGTAVGSMVYGLRQILGDRNVDFLHDFQLGRGERDRFYKDGSSEIESLARSPQADWLRNAFYENGAKTITGGERTPDGELKIKNYSHFRAFFETVWHSSIYNYTSIGLQVGGYAGETASAYNNGDGTVSYHIENVAGLRSLIPIFPNSPVEFSFVSNIRQTFDWTESIDQMSWHSTDYRLQNLKYDGLIQVGDDLNDTAIADVKRGINPLRDPEVLGKLMYLAPQLVAAAFDDGGGNY